MKESLCPHGHGKMEIISPQAYYCRQCQQNYIEQHICPICNQPLQIIKGCGAINYLCSNDGLISSRKVKFHYLPNEND